MTDKTIDAMVGRVADWLNAFKADPFSTGADKAERCIEVVLEASQLPSPVLGDVERARKLAAEIMVAMRQARFPKEYAAEAHDEFEALTLVPMLLASLQPNKAVSGDAVGQLRDLVFESLYHLRRDAAAEAYHKKAEAALASLPTTDAGDQLLREVLASVEFMNLRDCVRELRKVEPGMFAYEALSKLLAALESPGQ